MSAAAEPGNAAYPDRAHCCECYGKYLSEDSQQTAASAKHDDLSALLNVASEIVRSEYKPGDRPMSLDAADAFLKKVFQCATVSLGQAGLVVPDSFFLGGKSRG